MAVLIRFVYYSTKNTELSMKNIIHLRRKAEKRFKKRAKGGNAACGIAKDMLKRKKTKKILTKAEKLLDMKKRL